MIVYGSLIVVLIITLFFYLKFPENFQWWEILLPLFIVSLAVIGAKLLVDKISVTFDEYWGSTITQVVEEEPWNEWVVETCSEEYPCGTDSDGNTTYCTRYYDCSHQDDYGPEWYLKTNIGEKVRISESFHDKLKKEWGTNSIKLKVIENYSPRSRAVGSRGTKFEGQRVGDYSYYLGTNWNQKDENRYPFFTLHRYENRIKASDLSVFNLKIVSEEEAKEMGLYEYPKLTDNLNYPTILGDNINPQVQHWFQQLNGKFGSTKQLRLWVLIFKNKSELISEYQKNYWVNGNKNELVICIGIDDKNQIQWVNDFSWSRSQELLVDIKQKIYNLYEYKDTTITFDMPNILPIQNQLKKSLYNTTKIDTSLIPDNVLLGSSNKKTITKKVKKYNYPILTKNTYKELNDYLNVELNRFERREFKEFDYITVEPKMSYVIFIYILAIVLTVLINIWSIRNDYDN